MNKQIIIYPLLDPNRENPILDNRIGFLIEREGHSDVVIQPQWNSIDQLCSELSRYISRQILSDNQNFIDINKN